MIFEHLSKGDLQRAIGEDLLERLERIVPALEGAADDPTLVYRRQTLLSILSAFSPAQRMANSEFRRLLFDSLPPAELDGLIEAIDLEIDQSLEFRQKVDTLVKEGWRDREFCLQILNAAQLPRSYAPSERKELPAQETVVVADSPYKRLQDFQLRVYESAMDQLDIPRSRFLIQLPTGAGKTRTSMEFICDVLRRTDDGFVVWLAHSEELCEQCIDCLRETWWHLGDTPLEIQRWYGGSSIAPSDLPERAFIVAGFQKFHSYLKREGSASLEGFRERVSLVLVDEAHRVLAPTYKRVTQSLMGSETKLVGLTATPGRSMVDDAANEALAEFFFSRQLGLKPPPGTDAIEFLRQRGVLARVRMDPLRTGRGIALTKRQLSYIERRFDYPPGVLEKLGEDDIRNVEIVRRLKELVQEGKQVLFFACTVAHSRFICALLVQQGISAAHLDGGTPRNSRRALIEEFREGSIRALCNYGVLTTGFDAPRIDAVMIGRPTLSIVLYSQMLGRGLRGPKFGGTEYCTVVNVMDNMENLPEEADIFSYFSDYWDTEAQA